MTASRNLPAALLACVLLACAPAASFAQKGDQKKDPPKEEKVVPKEDKQPKNDRPRDNDQNRNRDNNNKKPPFSFF
jgi:hypothetical protein